MDCPIQARSTYRHNILRVLPDHPNYKIGDQVYVTSDPRIIHQEYRSEVPGSYSKQQVDYIASNYAGRFGEIKAISQWKWFLIGIKGVQSLADEWFPPFALLLLKMVPEKAHLPYFNIPNLNVIINPVPEMLAKFHAHSKLNTLALCGREATVVKGPDQDEYLTVELLNEISNKDVGGQQYTIHYSCCYFARRDNFLLPPSVKLNSPLTPTSRTPILAHIALPKVLSGNVLERNALYSELVKRGWAVVLLDKKMTEAVQRSVAPLQQFFARKDEYKEAFNLAHVFGYTQVGHKESFRWLTGHRMNKAMLPTTLIENLTNLTQLFDRTMTQLIDKVSLDFWGVPADKLGDYCDLPILQTARAQLDPFHQRWAMMDVAHYYNDQDVFDKVASKQLPANINCDSHCDPGLLSLSVLSTAPGLELFDFASNQWYRFDNSNNHFGQLRAKEASANMGHDVAILWTGKAAHFANSLMPPCIHRVTREVGQARLAMWYEICTASQEPSINSTLDNGTATKERARAPSDTIDVSEFIKLAAECSGAKYAQADPQLPNLFSPSSKASPAQTPPHSPNPNPFGPSLRSGEHGTGIPPTKSPPSPTSQPAPTPPPNPFGSPSLLSHERRSGIPSSKVFIPQKILSHEMHTGIPNTKNPHSGGSKKSASPFQPQSQILSNEFHSGIPMSKSMYVSIDQPRNKASANPNKLNRKSAPSQLEDLSMEVELNQPNNSRVNKNKNWNNNNNKMLSSEGRSGIPVSKSNPRIQASPIFLSHEDDSGIPMTKDDGGF